MYDTVKGSDWLGNLALLLQLMFLLVVAVMWFSCACVGT